MDPLFGPCDHAEAVAMFRAAVIGHLAHAQLARGQLRCALAQLAEQSFRPPGARTARRYGFSTLERWYYAYKKGGLEALKPKPRCDRGHGQHLSDELKTLLCEIRKSHPSASVPLILDTLIRQGQLEEGAVSPSTIRRLFRRQGIDSGHRACAQRPAPTASLGSRSAFLVVAWRRLPRTGHLCRRGPQASAHPRPDG